MVPRVMFRGEYAWQSSLRLHFTVSLPTFSIVHISILCECERPWKVHKSMRYSLASNVGRQSNTDPTRA